MSILESVYNIFNSDGKLLQLEYGLEALYDTYPIVAILADDEVIFVSKKITQLPLQSDEHNAIHKIADGLYMNITGLPADVDYILDRSKTLAASTQYTLGCNVAPDVFSTILAEKLQVFIQKSSKRTPAFAAMIGGFENGKPMLCYTDMSAVQYPCFAWAAGRDHTKMQKYLEKNYGKQNAVVTAIAALLESIGKDAEAAEIQVGILRADGIEYLNEKAIDKILQDISENH